MIDITDVEVFKGLTELEIGDRYFDLHNDFVCYTFSLSAENGNAEMKLISNDKNMQVHFVFKDAQIKKMYMNRQAVDYGIVNNFYRGRVEVNGRVLDYFNDGASYFYLEFENGDLFEIKASKLLFDLLQ